MNSQVISMLTTILPVALMLAVGVICRKYKIFSDEGIGALKNFVVNIGLPAVLIHAFATMEYSVINVIVTVMMFVLCVVAYGAGYLCRGLFGKNGNVIAFLTTGFEAGMLGYALYTMLYGADQVFEFARFDLGQVLFVFTLYKVLVGLQTGEKQSAKELVGAMVKSPVIIAIVVGVVLGATGLYGALAGSGISSVIDACTDFVSAPVSAVILLTIGYDLVFAKIPWGAVCKAVGIRLVIMAIIRVLVGFTLKPLGLTGGAASALTVMVLLPPPYVLPVFAKNEEQRTFLASVLTVSTLITIIGFVVLAVLGI